MSTTTTGAPVRMGVDPEKLKSQPPLQDKEVVEVRLVGFRPKKNKKGDGVNYNAILQLVNHPMLQKFPEYKIFDTLSNKMPKVIQDFTHAFGFPLEPTGELVGQWVPDPNDVANVEKYQYKGPLIGKTARIEVGTQNWENQGERSAVRRYYCKVDQCATKFPDIRHSTDLLKKK